MLVDALIQAHLYAGADLVLVYMSPRTHIQAHVYTGADVVLVDAPCSSLGVIYAGADLVFMQALI